MAPVIASSPDIAPPNDSSRAYAAPRWAAYPGGRRIWGDYVQRGRVMAPCHRRFIANHAVLLDGLDVRHLMPAGKLRISRPAVRMDGNEPVYDQVYGRPSDSRERCGVAGGPCVSG